jgi:hypothetical protein
MVGVELPGSPRRNITLEMAAETLRRAANLAQELEAA